MYNCRIKCAKIDSDKKSFFTECFFNLIFAVTEENNNIQIYYRNLTNKKHMLSPEVDVCSVCRIDMNMF